MAIPDRMLMFPEQIYIKYLQTIQDIKFTPREIDVISFLVSGRSMKKIASFFDLAPKTIETHTRNVMQKLGCNSKEGIIDFIEQSSQFVWIKKYYVTLLEKAKFESFLKDIAKSYSLSNLSYHILYWPSAEVDKFYIEQLKKHLGLAGIKTVIKVKEEKDRLDHFLHKCNQRNIDNFVILLTQTQSTLQITDEVKQFLLTNQKIKKPLIFLLDNIDHQEELDRDSKIEIINLQNYYKSCIFLLKNLIKNSQFDKFALKFEKQFYFSNEPSLVDVPQIQYNNPTLKHGNAKSFRHYLHKQQWFFGAILAFLTILGSSPLFLKKIRTNVLSLFELHQKDTPIRSDLFLPKTSELLQRPALTAQISKALKNQKGGIRTVALVGIGGAGKTTLARQYALLSSASVIWEINAETKNTLLSSFQDLAWELTENKDQRLEIESIFKNANHIEKEKKLLSFIKQRLKRKKEWLFIYDNVESYYQIKKYLPRDSRMWGNGAIIITTRDMNIQNTDFTELNNVIPLKELTKEEALKLFSSILCNEELNKLSVNRKLEALHFLRNIPFFPLDISIVAHYMKSEHLNYEQYLIRTINFGEELKKSQENLLLEISDYPKTRYDIIISSLKKLLDESEDFKDLLFLICLLDSQNIPKSLLEFYKTKPVVDRFLYQLRKKGLILDEYLTHGKESVSVLSIHRTTLASGLSMMNKLLSKQEKEVLTKNILMTLKSYYNQFLSTNCRDINSVSIHLEVLLHNLKQMKFSYNLFEDFKKEILKLLAYSHYVCSSNYLLAKKYFFKLLEDHYINGKELAEIYKDLASIYVDLNDNDKAILYASKSTNLCKDIPNSDFLLIENLVFIGYAYSKKNDFNKAEYYLLKALKRIPKLEPKIGLEIKSQIYGALSLAHSSYYMNKNTKAVEYAVKALEILNSSTPFGITTKKTTEKISCEIARNKWRLGQAYRLSGRYKEAIDQGFQDAQYIIDNSLSKCDHSLLQIFILYGVGEAMLRLGDIKKAEEKLTISIKESDKLVGDVAKLDAYTNRAEARIRLQRYTEAYGDCLAVFALEKKNEDNHTKLLYLNTFYHAAIIKYKEQNYFKSAEYFLQFFKQANDFCKAFLDEKAYKDLNLKVSFTNLESKENANKTRILKYIDLSTEIFTSIYGHTHPFIQDYIMINLKNAKKNN